MAARHSCVDTSTCSPRPVARRAKRAPSEPMAAFRPAWKPDWSPNALRGGRSGRAGSPLSAAMPRARREALEDLAPARAGEIEGNAALVGVEIEKEAALLGMGDVARKGAARARRVALSGRLDLDHRRAEIREELRGIGGGHAAPHLEDVELVEGRGHVSRRSRAVRARRPSGAPRGAPSAPGAR